MRRTMKKFFLLVVCVMVATVGGWCYRGDAVQASDAKRTVRIGCFPMRGYNDIDENGNVSGMDVDYLEEISRYADWDLEYVPCGSWDNALTKLSV